MKNRLVPETAVNPELPSADNALPDQRTLNVSNLHKSYSGVTAVKGIDFVVKEREFLTLLGPSGCGKTTLLRCVAGLEQVTRGRIALGSMMFSDAATREFTRPERRNIGMVFQSYALWPHMTVEENVMYPLRMRKTPRRDARARAHQVLELVSLLNLAQRPVANLSGGQQQRVALARAVVATPQLLLFDEPLSNLDASLRASLRKYILDVHRAAECMSIYVTHDQSEAFSLSDRVAVMFDGEISQIDTPANVYNRPADIKVAKFLGFDNFLQGRLIRIRDGLADVEVPELGLISSVAPTVPIQSGQSVYLAARAHHISLRLDDGSALQANEVVGRVITTRDAQSVVECEVDVGGVRLVVRTFDVIQEMPPARPNVGAIVRVRIGSSHTVVVPAT